MSKNYDPEKDLQRQDDYDPKNEVEPYNTMDIEAVLDKAFGNCNKKEQGDSDD